MALPKITLSAGIAPKEGAIGTYLISLDTAALGADYIFSSHRMCRGTRRINRERCASFLSTSYGQRILSRYKFYR